MKIISPYKDYYDSLVHVYGTDPLVVYKRNKIENTTVTTKNNIFRNYINWPLNWKIKHFVIAGRYYLLVKTDNVSWHLFNSAEYLQNKKGFNLTSNSYYAELEEKAKGSELPELVDISKQVNAPVFSISKSVNYLSGTRSSYQFEIHEYVPKLADYGFGNIIKPEIMYQDIMHFLSNVLKENPDTKPPVIIKDKDLIVSKGFDLKQSFRHRKQ